MSSNKIGRPRSGKIRICHRTKIDTTTEVKGQNKECFDKGVVLGLERGKELGTKQGRKEQRDRERMKRDQRKRNRIQDTFMKRNPDLDTVLATTMRR